MSGLPATWAVVATGQGRCWALLVSAGAVALPGAAPDVQARPALGYSGSQLWVAAVGAAAALLGWFQVAGQHRHDVIHKADAWRGRGDRGGVRPQALGGCALQARVCQGHRREQMAATRRAARPCPVTAASAIMLCRAVPCCARHRGMRAPAQPAHPPGRCQRTL